ncbi:MAG: HU family DNA-binding protein [Candidatus Babeliales bacterium]
MNKAALIEQMAKDTKLPKTACKSALESFVEAIEGALKKNKTVVLTGFGTFSVMKRKARTGINPATGATMKIPAKKVPKFKAGKKLKDLVKKA